MPTDAFAHHPELRGLIIDPDRSDMRGFDPFAVAARRPELEMEKFLLPQVKREASRREALADAQGDFWVFAYGSLMWDPAFRFVELRRAHVADHARRFILKDIYGARGTADRPGLMAALDHGPGCEGLAFRIAAAELVAETEILWRREMAGSAYQPRLVKAATALGPITALTFVADPAARAIDRDIPREQQVRYIATGSGFFGSSFDYLVNIATQFAALGIEDAEVAGLVRDTTTYRAGMAEPDGGGA